LEKSISAGELNENRLAEYADSRKTDEVVVGLSLLCRLPVNVIERVLFDQAGAGPDTSAKFFLAHNHVIPVSRGAGTSYLFAKPGNTKARI
jgi:hypothetical protein